MELGIIGTSIWQQNMPLLEQLTIDRDDKSDVLQKLKADLGFDELIYLGTCNRVEFIYTTSGKYPEGRLLHRLIDFFFSKGKNINFFPNDFYHFTGKEAIAHLFRTTASLESLVMGENQITCQVKTAHQEALENGLCGRTLDSLVREALTVARKVKSLTSLGAGSLSMASLASNQLQDNLKSVREPAVALIGSGTMQAKLAEYIKDNLRGKLLFVNRTLEKAEKLAEEFGGTAVSLTQFRQAPASVDAIVSATAAVEPVFDIGFLEELSKHGKCVICIDLAVPRDFSLDFDDDNRVKLVDIPLLKSKGQGNLRQKFVEAGKANEIVREAVNKYLSDRIEISLKPIFRDCFEESIQLANQALDDLFSRRITSLEEKEREAVRHVVTKLIGQSSFGPIKKLSDRLVEKRSQLNISDLGSVHEEAV